MYASTLTVDALSYCAGKLANGYSIRCGEAIGAALASLGVQTAIVWHAVDRRQRDSQSGRRGVGYRGQLVQMGEDGHWYFPSDALMSFLSIGGAVPDDIRRVGSRFTEGTVGELIPWHFHNRYWLPTVPAQRG